MLVVCLLKHLKADQLHNYVKARINKDGRKKKIK